MPYFTQFLTVFKFSCPTTLDFTRVTDRMKSVFHWLFESLKRPIYGHSRNSVFSNVKILFIVSMNTALAALIIDTTLLVRKHILL